MMSFSFRHTSTYSLLLVLSFAALSALCSTFLLHSFALAALAIVTDYCWAEVELLHSLQVQVAFVASQEEAMGVQLAN
jgi:hypothetical protein